MARGDTTYFLGLVYMNNNWDPNAENVTTVVKGGKVYTKIGNQLFLSRVAAKPNSPNKKHNVNILGPGTYFVKNPNKKRNAMNVVRTTQAKQMQRAKNTMNGNQYNKFVSGLLKENYVANVLESVGKQKFKNWVAISKNNGSIRGFAIVHNNSRNGRNVNVIATRTGEKVGSLLMRHIIANARKNRKQIIHLTSVKSAINFYKKLGFKGTGNGNLVPMTLRIS